jgi:hypothetical protein
MRQKLWNLVGLFSSTGKGVKLDKDPVAGHVRDARFWVKMRRKLWNVLLSSTGKGLKLDKVPVQGMYGMRGYAGQGFPGYNAGFHQSGMSGTGYEQYNQQFNTAQVTLLGHSLPVPDANSTTNSSILHR